MISTELHSHLAMISTNHSGLAMISTELHSHLAMISTNHGKET